MVEARNNSTESCRSLRKIYQCTKARKKPQIFREWLNRSYFSISTLAKRIIAILASSGQEVNESEVTIPLIKSKKLYYLYNIIYSIILYILLSFVDGGEF